MLSTFDNQLAKYSMHSAVQNSCVTIIGYKPLSGLNFDRYTG